MENKTAIITGGSRGIGKAIALEFASKGYNVVINYRDEKKAEEVKQELDRCGASYLLVRGDIVDMAEVENMFKEAIDCFGSIEVLVNNAGITRDNLTVRMSQEEFDQVIDVNLKGSFYCMKEAAKHMMKKRQGSIISLSSISGLRGNPGQINYAASKAGLIGMSKTLAKELASRNIRCNCIAPGFIDTEMTSKIPEKAKEKFLDSIPLKRYGRVEDIAKLAYFLGSNDSSYITGQVFSVDGGMSI